MKTLILEIEEKSYSTLLDFLRSLPEHHCRILDDEELSNEELRDVQSTLQQIQQGDYSAFESWEVVKQRI